MSKSIQVRLQMQVNTRSEQLKTLATRVAHPLTRKVGPPAILQRFVESNLANSRQDIQILQRAMGNQFLKNIATELNCTSTIPVGAEVATINRTDVRSFVQREDLEKPFQLKKPSLLEPAKRQMPSLQGGQTPKLPSLLDKELHLNPELLPPGYFGLPSVPFATPRHPPRVPGELPAWLRPKFSYDNSGLLNELLKKPPITPPPPAFLRQMSEWLTGTLHRRDIARIAGKLAAIVGFDEQKTRKKLDEAMIKAGEKGLKELLSAILKAIAGSPTTVDPDKPRPTGPPEKEILPAPHIFQLPVIRW